MVRRYIEKHPSTLKGKKVYTQYHKMVLAVGESQVESLSQRYEEFKELFPRLKKINREEIAQVEPKVMKGRDPDQPVLALWTDTGYTMDYEALSNSFIEQVNKESGNRQVFFDTKILRIEKQAAGYKVKTNKGDLYARFVLVQAGGHSLLFAQSLGYGKDLALLSVAGSFYLAPKQLNGKVYTMQMKKLPFAAIHGDPDVHNQNETRFGPIAKPIFLLERYNYSTFFEYVKTLRLGVKTILSLINILKDPIILKFIIRQFTYDLPLIGKRRFIKEVRKVIPSITLEELRFAKGIGGTRPQVINKNTKSLDMGEAKLSGENIVFNITPSPGASTCLQNAYADVQKVIEYFKEEFVFDKERFDQEFID